MNPWRGTEMVASAVTPPRPTAPPPPPSATTYDPPQPNAALVVGPDDVLVVSYPPLSHDQVNQVRETLAEKCHALASDQILIFSGAERIAVIRKDTAPTLAPGADQPPTSPT